MAPPTAIAPQKPKGPFPGVVNPGDLALVFTAADIANGNKFQATARDLLIVQNSDVAAQTFTLTSVGDEHGRKGDVTAYSIPAGGFAAFWIGTAIGWEQGDGTVLFTGSVANVKFAIVSIPV